MTSRLVLAAAALALSGVGSFASAQTVNGQVDVNGTVANRCQFTLNNAVLDIGEMSRLTGAADQFGRLDAAKLNGQSRNLSGWCNGAAATMTVEAEPLELQDAAGAPPPGFENRVDYVATATVSNESSAQDTTATDGPGAASSVGMFAGDVVVTFSGAATPGSGRLIAGAYQGRVVVTLAPAVSLPQL